MATNGERGILSPGTLAPDFVLESTQGQVVLSDFRGQPVILVFYPEDQSPVCSSQLALYNESLPIFAEHNAALLAISTDDLAAHRAFAADLNLSFPLLADDNPPGAVAQAFGVYNAANGTAERALFVLDAGGVIRWRQVTEPHVNPGAHGILFALEQVAPV